MIKCVMKKIKFQKKKNHFCFVFNLIGIYLSGMKSIIFFISLIYPTAGMCETDCIQEIFEFNADHPFIFHLFSDDLEVSIFTGHFSN